MIESRFLPEYVSHVDYNKFVQSVQRDADVWGFEHRVLQRQSRAYFELYYDGKWHRLGSEVPFAPTDAARGAQIFTQLWSDIQFKAAGELAGS